MLCCNLSLNILFMGNETRTEEEQMLVQFTFQILKYLFFFCVVFTLFLV